MSQLLLQELGRENLCTHFILPLTKLSKFNFTPAGFINTYLTRDRFYVVVKIGEVMLLSRAVLTHPDYSNTYKDTDGNYLVVFRINARWRRDVELFCQGKFSQLSTKAKDFIRRYSKLDYKKKEGTKVVTDGRLLALERHEVLKRMWERELYDGSNKAIDDPDRFLPEEYLSSPGEETFINPEGLTRIRETQL